jgi:hypothetical protein
MEVFNFLLPKNDTQMNNDSSVAVRRAGKMAVLTANPPAFASIAVAHRLQQP